MAMFHTMQRTIAQYIIFTVVGFMGCSCSTAYNNVIAQYDDYIKGATVEKINFYAQQGPDRDKHIKRTGLLVRYKNAVATILLCHGFMCDKFDAGFLRRLFPQGRFNVMSFDFRAHGENIEGQYCTFGRDEAYDVLAAAHFLKEHPDIKNKPLLVYGFSMGAVAAIEAQAQDPSLFKAMILDCPYDSSENIIKRGLDNAKFSLFGYEFSIPGRTLLQKYAFHPYVQSLVKTILKTVAKMDAQNIDLRVYPVNTAESIKKVSVPCFFIHCKHDEKVSVDAIKAVYNGAIGYKKLWLTNGRRHFDSFFYSPEKYTERVREFLEQVVRGKLDNKVEQKIIEDIDDT